jgi:hypothetical protein
MRPERQFSFCPALPADCGKLLLLAALACPALANAQSSDVDQQAGRLMQAQVAYEKMQPKGMTIEAKEISRSGSSGKDLVVQYHVLIKGARAGAVFQEIDWPIAADEPSKSLAGISLASDGTLLCPERTEPCGDSTQPGEPISFTTHPKPGEPTRLAFESEGVRIGLVINPDPIKSRDKLCTLEAIRLTPKVEVGYISGSGYPANSDVHYKVMPLSDQDFTVKADPSGTIRTIIAPRTGGNANLPIRIKINEAACSPEVAYEFGS